MVHKFFKKTIGILVLTCAIGLGSALAIPKFAQAHRTSISESTIKPNLDDLPVIADRQWISMESSKTAKVINNASTSFTIDLAASEVLTDVYDSSVAWGDYDNDGDLDILITGNDREGGFNFLSSVYENTGSSFSEDLATSDTLTDVANSSAAWGDYDNDGDLDILITGNDSGLNRLSSVYKNTGSGFEVDLAASDALVDVAYGSAAWGDYDNDGDLDILLTGRDTSFNPFSSVYENTGSGFEEDLAASISLRDVDSSSVAWGDYDKDGDLDILITGRDASSNPLSSVYANIGSGFEEDISASSTLPGVSGSSVAWGDYDNDSDLDILLTGRTSTSIYISRVYENTGSGFTLDVAASNALPGVVSGSVAWGDYDNDGDLDILLTGNTDGANRESFVFENTGSGFNEDTAASISLPDVGESSVAWGDYDNDGDLDILLTGYDGSNTISSVYRNNATTTNTPPGAPRGLSSSAFSGGKVRLSWNPPSPLTYTTPHTGLTYNLRVGTSLGKSDILAPMSCVGACGISGDGYRQVPIMGAANHGLTATLDLPPGTYYWSVQAVDHTFSGSPWAFEGFFPSLEINLPVVYR